MQSQMQSQSCTQMTIKKLSLHYLNSQYYSKLFLRGKKPRKNLGGLVIPKKM